MKINITPVAKPRMTRSDKWKKRPCVLKYRAFCDELRLKHKGELPSSVDLSFNIPMPESWSKKRKMEMEGKPHQQKPDVDNLTKSVLDALCADDSYVWRIKSKKRWAYEGSIIIKAL